MKKNGYKNDDNGKCQRDEKGRFVLGGPGGPGRKRKRTDSDSSPIDIIEAAEKILLQDMSSDNASIRQKAVGTIINLMKLRGQLSKKENKYSKLSPIILALVRKISEENSGDIEPEFYEIINKTN